LSDTHKTVKIIIHHLKGRGYHTQFLLYPRPLMWWKINLCCFMCHSTMCLTRCYKTAFYIYICCFSISIHSWDTATSAFRKQMDAIWKFYFRFRFWAFYRHEHVNFIRIGRSATELWRCVYVLIVVLHDWCMECHVDW